VNYPSLLLWSLICLFVFALVFFPYENVKGEHDIEINYISICSLTYAEPFYNCNEHWWVMWTLDSPLVEALDDKAYLGFAYYKDDNNDGKTDSSSCDYLPELAEFNEEYDVCGWKWMVMGNRIMDTCWDGNCKTLLNHELDHIKCECNWHENMTSSGAMI